MIAVAGGARVSRCRVGGGGSRNDDCHDEAQLQPTLSPHLTRDTYQSVLSRVPELCYSSLIPRDICVSHFYFDEYLEASLVFSHSVTITITADVTHDSEHLTIRKCCARSELTHGSKRVVATII